MRHCAAVLLLLVSTAFCEWKVAENTLLTKWSKQVTPENAWQEYPRPQMVRSDWQNLNGLWQYAVAPSAADQPDNWQGQILVPFCLESALSGIKGKLTPADALWYQRTFTSAKTDSRTLLHFEAVDYEMTAWVNGKKVGNHTGGNLPFTFDITDAVKDGDNELVVKVLDATGPYQLRGKQTLDPKGIWYTAVSGIWQTVWLENVPQRYISDLKINTDIDPAEIRINAALMGKPAKKESILVKAKLDGKVVAEKEGRGELVLAIDNAKLWTPDTPCLYDIEISLKNAKGKVIDEVKSYTGIRTVGKKLDADGNLRFTLNNEFIFHWGPLDQGWWPDGLLTPPSDDAMLYDIVFLKDSGFNMIRKHIKVEPRRYYYHCDRVGMMVWQDQVAAYIPDKKWVQLDMKDEPTEEIWSDDAHKQYMDELKGMIDSLSNYPSIVVWVPFNEAWGQHRTMEVGKWVTQYDRTRLINIASGGNFWPIGDIADQHKYPEPFFPFDDSRYDGYVKVVGEFGGHKLLIKDHTWDQSKKNWGYGKGAETPEQFRETYERSIRKLADLKKQGVAGGVYTQTTDVEIELNGLLTYDREVQKLDTKTLHQIHEVLFDQAPDDSEKKNSGN